MSFIPDCVAVITTDGTEVAHGPFFSTGSHGNVHDFLDLVDVEIQVGLRPESTRARIIELELPEAAA